MNIRGHSFSSVLYCPIKLKKSERPFGCGLPIEHPDSIIDCDWCPKNIELNGLTFRGLKVAKKHKGSNLPEIDPKETFKDNRFKKPF